MMFLLLVSFSAWASVGEIVTGESIQLERNGTSQSVTTGFELENGDTLTIAYIPGHSNQSQCSN